MFSSMLYGGFTSVFLIILLDGFSSDWVIVTYYSWCGLSLWTISKEPASAWVLQNESSFQKNKVSLHVYIYSPSLSFPPCICPLSLSLSFFVYVFSLSSLSVCLCCMWCIYDYKKERDYTSNGVFFRLNDLMKTIDVIEKRWLYCARLIFLSLSLSLSLSLPLSFAVLFLSSLLYCFSWTLHIILVILECLIFEVTHTHTHTHTHNNNNN